MPVQLLSPLKEPLEKLMIPKKRKSVKQEYSSVWNLNKRKQVQIG